MFVGREKVLHFLPFHFTKIGRWWNKTDEIDIMAGGSEKGKLFAWRVQIQEQSFGSVGFEGAAEKIHARPGKQPCLALAVFPERLYR